MFVLKNVLSKVYQKSHYSHLFIKSLTSLLKTSLLLKVSLSVCLTIMGNLHRMITFYRIFIVFGKIGIFSVQKELVIRIHTVQKMNPKKNNTFVHKILR